MILINYLATWLYDFERYYSNPNLDQKWYDNFLEYQNNYFIQLTTVVGVGIGFAYPASIPGRLVTSIACMCTFFVLSIIIKAMYSKMMFTSKEESAYHIMH